MNRNLPENALKLVAPIAEKSATLDGCIHGVIALLSDAIRDLRSFEDQNHLTIDQGREIMLAYQGIELCVLALRGAHQHASPTPDLIKLLDKIVASEVAA